MQFDPIEIAGAFIIRMEPHTDFRGYYARTFCEEEFEKHGLQGHIVQLNTIHTKQKSTIRGLHYQAAPHQETKCIRCLRGAIYDVIADVRPGSSTYGIWFGIELHEDGFEMLYVPEGVAHGFQTLKDNCLVAYHVTESYHPECERAVRWNDPLFNVIWPMLPPILSVKDEQHPDL